MKKIVYWLEIARREGSPVDAMASRVMVRIGWTDRRGALTAAALARNHRIAESLGCLDAQGMEDMRQGKSPIVRLGPYKGEPLETDHIIPYSRYPQLGNVLVNLELMPRTVNRAKGSKMGQRQFDLLRKLRIQPEG